VSPTTLGFVGPVGDEARDIPLSARRLDLRRVVDKAMGH
jgi:hypothetical protein